MKHIKFIFVIAIIGIIIGFVSAYIYAKKVKAEAPLAISYNPYVNGIYATGMIESYQENGMNINIYPEVSGVVKKIFVTDGSKVKKNDLLFAIDDSTQRNIVAKDKADTEAAFALLEKLRAAPRKEDLEVATAQLTYAQNNLTNMEDQYNKINHAYTLNPKSVSKNDFDNAINAKKIAKANYDVAKAQYDLVKAGTWSYDITNQEKNYQALNANYEADKALLEKYIIKAPVSGEILNLTVALGGYVSSNGVYETTTQTMKPALVMGIVEPYLQVRCYVDEILIAHLPKAPNLEAKLLVRGENNYTIPLEFVRIQPYTVPNINLSYEKAVRVDVRVLPIIFRFVRPVEISLYPGELVDVYIKGKNLAEDNNYNKNGNGNNNGNGG